MMSIRKFRLLFVALSVAITAFAGAREAANGSEAAPPASASVRVRDAGTTNTATQTPTVTPTPSPPATQISFIPPLSLRECMKLIDAALTRIPLEEEVIDVSTVPTRSLNLMIRSIHNYLQYRDDLHTSLANYRWVVLESAKVQNKPDEVDLDTYEFIPPVPYISALSLQVEEGDAYIHRLRVFDEKGLQRDAFDYRAAPKLLRHSLPRREVFHLWRRTTVSRIEIEYAAAIDNPPIYPQVVLFGGITDEREYIKTAIYYLEKARNELNQQKYAESRNDLIDARRLILRYLEDRGN